MKTNIIPEIKNIVLLEDTICLSDFKIDKSIERMLPVCSEIFDCNEPFLGEKPIKHIPDSLDDEEYKIVARKDKIEIYALTPIALMYGLFTLSELFLLNDNVILECDIHDLPTLHTRALSDDVSRGQISTFKNFCDIIKKLARYKYNIYMPYIEDVYQYDCCKAWGRYSDPVSMEEWRAIAAFAKRYQLEVRPIINLLGHQDKSNRIKELQPLMLKNKDGSPSSVFDPKHPEVRPLISKMIHEIVDCFGEGVIHCGGDEPTALTEVYGKEEGGRLFIEHYTFISEELAKVGCTMMMYADFFAPPWGDYAVPVTRAKELPEGTQFVFWDYAVRETYPFVDALIDQDLSIYISPGTWTWKRLSCDIRTCFDNTRGLLKADHGRSCGMIMSSWADGGDTLRELTWPGVLVGANFCWHTDSSYSFDEFFDIYHESFFGFTPNQSAVLEPIYHHDVIIKREDNEFLQKEFFRDPFEPVPFIDYNNIGILQEAMIKARADLNSLSPLRNRDAFNALYLTVERVLFCANRIALLPQSIPDTIEELHPYADKALQLAGQIKEVKELHKRLWFDCNRASEWAICEVSYDDLYDKLNMFARNCRSRMMYSLKKN